MILTNAELNVIMTCLAAHLSKDPFRNTKAHDPSPAKTALEKLKEFMETSGTICPTAILSCPQKMGSSTSAKKKAASAANGAKGGRPHKDGTPANHKTET